MKKYSSLLRVKHYIKNILIFLPLIFSGHFMSIKLLTVSFIEFLSFSLAASVVYIFNDLLDYESDKKHPIKKKRAIASGAVSKGKAKGILVFLFILTELIQFVLYKSNIFSLEQYLFSNAFILIYIVLNLLYSKWAKHIPIVDIMTLASGFLLRVYFGGVVVDVEISSWLYLTVLSGALYLVIGKRRGELLKNKADARPVLKYYTKEFLDKFMYLFLALTLVFYSLWCTVGGGNLLIYSLLFVIFIVMRYSLIVEGDSLGDPVDVLFQDKILLVTVLLYGIYMGGVLYG